MPRYSAAYENTGTLYYLQYTVYSRNSCRACSSSTRLTSMHLRSALDPTSTRPELWSFFQLTGNRYGPPYNSNIFGPDGESRDFRRFAAQSQHAGLCPLTGKARLHQAVSDAKSCPLDRKRLRNLHFAVLCVSFTRRGAVGHGRGYQR